MAGLAGLMTRKKRDRRRELELKMHKQESGSTTEMRLPAHMFLKCLNLFCELTGKEAQEALEKKLAHESIKKMLVGKELLHQKSKSFDAFSQSSHFDDDPANDGRNPYSLIYLGLVFICMGLVMTFVGLGEKGFKTVQLKMVGPIFGLVGLACIVVKVLHCTFPDLFQVPAFITDIIERKRGKLKDSDKSNLMEKAETPQNGHFGANSTPLKNLPEILSPRVVLQSAKTTPRPQSTIPNYIEHSSDEDDFDKSTSRNRYNYSKANSDLMDPIYNTSSNNMQIQVQQSHLNSSNHEGQPGVGVGGAMTTIHRHLTDENKKDNGVEEEIILTPKGLLL